MQPFCCELAGTDTGAPTGTVIPSIPTSPKPVHACSLSAAPPWSGLTRSTSTTRPPGNDLPTPSCWPPASPSSSTSQAWMDFRPPARSSLPSPGHTRTGRLPGPRLRQRALITGLRPRGTELLPVGDPLAAGAHERIPWVLAVVATGLVGRVRWGAWLPLPLDCGHDFVGSRNHVVGSSPSTPTAS